MSLGIPKREQFEVLITATTRRERVALNAPLQEIVERLGAGESLVLADLEPFANLCDVAFEKDVQAIKKLAAYRWLFAQRGLSEAFGSMRRSEARRAKPGDSKDWSFRARAGEYLKTPTRETVMQYMSASDIASLIERGRLDQTIAERQSKAWMATRMKSFLSRERDRVAYSALLPIARAFRDYFYRDRPSELRTLRVTLSSVENSAAKLLRLLDKALLSAAENSLLADTISSTRRNAESLMRPFDRDIGRLDVAFQVAARKDAQAKERILIHDLYFGLRSVGRRPGAAALADFLTCDGVHSRLDVRTIERHIARFKQRDRQ